MFLKLFVELYKKAELHLHTAPLNKEFNLQ